MAENARIQSVLARAVTNIDYIRYLENSGDVNARLIKPAARNKHAQGLDGIVKFAAFISKVQHNFLWNDFPVSYKLMHTYKLEITIFTAYLPLYHQKKRHAGHTAAQKTDCFIDFLKNYLLRKKDKHHRILYHAVMHEDSIRRLKQAVPATTMLPGATSILSGAVVNINGCFHIHHFAVQPEDIPTWVQPGKKITLARKKEIFVYWIDGQEMRTRVIGISREAEIILGCINNVNTIDYILHTVRQSMDESTASGILLFLLQNKIIYLNA